MRQPRVLVARRYRIERPLGRGGSGTTFCATDLACDTEVALKRLELEGDAAADAFRSEFARIAGLAHPHLVEVLDLGVERDHAGVARHHLTATLVRGRALSDVKATAFAEVVAPLVDALGALDHLHRAGMRHGDFKPGNVIVREDGRGVLIDLGAAAPLGRAAGTRITGTPRYLAPEVLAGEALDARADVYAVGVTLAAFAERFGSTTPASVIAIAKACRDPRRDRRPSGVSEILAALGVDAGSARDRASTTAHVAPRFLGRHEETAIVRVAIERLIAGEPGPRVIAIEGIEGVGKSRWARELKWLAQSRASIVVEGFADRPRAVSSMLDRALDAPLGGSGIAKAIEAHAAIVERGTPAVMVLDDVDVLGAEELETFRAFVRLARANDPYLVIAVGAKAYAPVDITRVIELGPLSTEDVGAWFPEASHARASEIARWTGGVPAAIASVAAQLDGAGDVATTRATGTSLSERRVAAIRGASDEARRLVALLASWEEALDDHELAELGCAGDAPWDARAAGVVVREGARWKLACASDGAALLAAMGDACASDARTRLVEWAKESDGERDDARIARLRLASGDRRGAIDSLLRARGDWARAPREWARVADAIVSAGEPAAPREIASCAEVLEVAGEPLRALDLLRSIASETTDRETRAAIAIAIASTSMKLGRPDAVIRALSDANDAIAATSRSAIARAADLTSRAKVKLGDYEGALRDASAALAHVAEEPVIRGDLLEDVGVASSYLGRHDDASAALSEAASCHAASSDARRETRTLLCWAIDDYRAGRIDESIERYRRALALAEEHALTDLVASSSLNLGSAVHQRGDWGEALLAYSRGGRIAAALGQTDVAVTLEFDLAKLHADIGSFAEADRALARARDLATRAGSRFFAAACDDLDGELRVLRDGAGGAAAFRSAERAFVEMGATREAVEVRLHLAELAARADVREARRWLDAATTDAASVAAPDLDVRVAIARATVELAAGDGGAARKALERAQSMVAGQAVGVVAAELDGLLADAWERDGAAVLASEHRKRARAIWERTAAGLPSEMRDVFWRHPRRRGLDRAADHGEPRAGGSSRREAKLERLLAVNRLLASTLESGEVLRRTMDAAIELTGAERGFLILRRAGELEVAVARNVDRERVGRSHLKFSRSIAERVIEIGEPIVTADATSDDRFSGEESVHAMRLRSVAAVPIRGPEEVLGALYLDNRFQPSRFDVSDMDLLTAFADQVAIALRNAEMHEALQRRTEELEREKARVEAAFRGQIERIEVLTEEVRTSREALARRYEYGEIVAGSAAMQRVLATLDRVIDSSLSVLVQGESGTGKELVARAIHVHSSRASGPFVGINCAALPESLLESELFGHVKGAFTGADKDRPGLMVAARGGTLFLDEIGEMPLPMQAKLLRALQEREVRPIGSSAPVAVDFRLVCATNRVLREEAEQGRFRRDLYYRIGVVEVTLPPLRERSEDVPAIASRVLDRLGRELGKTPAPRLSPRAMQALVRHPWPGNVRELENVLAKAAITAESDEIVPGDLDLRTREPVAHVPARRRATEKEEILDALSKTGGHAGKAARALGVSRATFYRRLTALGIVSSER